MSPSTEVARGLLIRAITPPLRLADFRLIAFDMDSTLISIECVDEIAAAVGRKPEVAAITEAAMRGEIADYKESLRRRVALLKGAPAAALHASTTSGCASTRASSASSRPAAPPGCTPCSSPAASRSSATACATG